MVIVISLKCVTLGQAPALRKGKKASRTLQRTYLHKLSRKIT